MAKPKSLDELEPPPPIVPVVEVKLKETVVGAQSASKPVVPAKPEKK